MRRTFVCVRLDMSNGYNACSRSVIGGPQARVPLYVPYADFYQYQAGAGRLADRA